MRATKGNLPGTGQKGTKREDEILTSQTKGVVKEVNRRRETLIRNTRTKGVRSYYSNAGRAEDGEKGVTEKMTWGCPARTYNSRKKGSRGFIYLTARRQVGGRKTERKGRGVGQKV